MADPGSPTTGFDTGAVSGMGAGGLAQRVGEHNAGLRARQIELDREIGREIARRTFTFDDTLTGPISNKERSDLLASQALRTGAQVLSPVVGESNFLGSIVKEYDPFFRGRGFKNPFSKTTLPNDALLGVWKTAQGTEMMPVWHGSKLRIDPRVGWSPLFPEISPHAYTTHDYHIASGFSGVNERAIPLAGDMPLSEYRRGFGYAPIFKEPEVRLSPDDWNKAFRMGPYIDDPLSQFSVKSIHNPGRFARAVPFAGAALGAVDVGYRAALGDYAGAVLSGIGMIPGPIGWAGLGTQMAYDIIMAGINNGTLETQQDIDESLGITGPPGIRGDY